MRLIRSADGRWDETLDATTGCGVYERPGEVLRMLRAAKYVLRLWFGISEPVGPLAYGLSGLVLAGIKYAVEAGAIWTTVGVFFSPLQFVNPLLSVRAQLVQPAPEWLGAAWFLWSLPFLWMALSLSVRRAADAGASPWLGLVVLVPLINLFFMVSMVFAGSTADAHWNPGASPPDRRYRMTSAIMGIAAALMLGGVMLAVTVYLLNSYGASLFLGTPVAMGAVAAYIHNHRHPRTYWASMRLGMAAVAVAGVALLLFALEGLICVLMAMPVMMPVGAFGGILGKAIADSTRTGHYGLLVAIACLPLVSGAERLRVKPRELMVMTGVEIAAPPEVVWDQVITFSQIRERPEWYFRWGIACPERARIVGQGPGAVRYCEFTTGAFVEPITVWEEPCRLAFNVAEQPAPMFELSPYRHVHPPHLDGFMRSTRGEFLLVALPDGGTRLEGRSWYELEMAPHGYWTLWSDGLIHRIHRRVLNHIKQSAEQSTGASRER